MINDTCEPVLEIYFTLKSALLVLIYVVILRSTAMLCFKSKSHVEKPLLPRQWNWFL